MDKGAKQFEHIDVIKKMIQSTLKKHYGLIPSDEDIVAIMGKAYEERNIEGTLQFILNRVENEILVLYSRDQSVLDRLKRFSKAASNWRKLVPAYLERAEMSYIKGNSIAGIFLCRLALEMALKDRMLTKEARRGNLEDAKKDLSDKMLGGLLGKSVGYGILDDRTINSTFRKLMPKGKTYKDKENVINKFIHGDFAWIKHFLAQEKKIDLAVYEKDKEMIAAHPDIISSFLFIEILKATYKLITKLYFKT